MSAPVPEGPEDGECYFCDVPVDPEAFCNGCHVFICEGCEAEYSCAAAGMGAHPPEHHLQEAPD